MAYYIFIAPADKRPIFLIDRSVLIDGKPMEISISEDMVAKGVSLKVRKTPFVLGRASSEKDIVIVDPNDVQYSSDDYFRDREKELKEAEASNVERKAEAVVESFQAFNAAVEKSIGIKGAGRMKSKKESTSI